MSNIRLIIGEKTYPFKSMYFHGGEPHVELLEEALVALQSDDARVLIDARVGSMNDFGTLLALTSAIKYIREDIMLFMPYFPGARQDRREDGFAFTAKMYADIINAQKYNTVFIVDPHSPVTPALLDFCQVLPTAEVVKMFIENMNITGLICPDAGAERRTLELAKQLGIEHVVFARKKRDPKTGSLSGFSLDTLPTYGDYLVVDDICDGGATFISLAKEYTKDPYRASLHLWVTHGIFSKGLTELFKHYTTIGCTDSFPSASHVAPLQVYRLAGSTYNEA